MTYFRWDLKTPCMKDNEYKSEAKKIILMVISTISQFWSPTLTNLWYSVFLSLFSMVCTLPLLANICSCGGLNIFSYLVARGWEYFKFLRDLLHYGVLIFFLGEGS